MTACVRAAIALIVVSFNSLAASAQGNKMASVKPVLFGRDVVPVLRTACLGCHSGSTPSGGYSVASYDDVVRAGRSGAIVVPGRPLESRLYRLVAGLSKPTMPPGAGLRGADVDVLRRWIESGAKRDALASKSTVSASVKGVSTSAPRPEFSVPGTLRPRPAPVNSLAFSPDGRYLAIGTYQKVVLIDVSTSKEIAAWAGHADAVRSLAFSADGKSLLAAGGLPGAFGEVRVWSLDAQAERSVFGDHADAIHAIAMHPDGKRIATASADKVVKVWDWATGKVLQTLRDHSDAVHGVAFHPGGKYLATCGSDKAAKVWDLETGKRLYSVGAGDDVVTSLQFNPSGSQLLTAGGDKRLRRWNFGAEGAPVWGIAMHGDRAATAGADGKVRVFNAANGQLAVFEGAGDWVYSVGFSPDGAKLAAGSFDGRVVIWDTATMKMIGTVSTVPSGASNR